MYVAYAGRREESTVESLGCPTAFTDHHATAGMSCVGCRELMPLGRLVCNINVLEYLARLHAQMKCSEPSLPSVFHQSYFNSTLLTKTLGVIFDSSFSFIQYLIYQ